MARERYEMRVTDAAWTAAQERVRKEQPQMTMARTLEVLLAAYLEGQIEVGTREVPRGVSRHPVAIDPTVWEGADAQRQDQGVPTMVTLCDALLSAYGRGDVQFQITAWGVA